MHMIHNPLNAPKQNPCYPHFTNEVTETLVVEVLG